MKREIELNLNYEFVTDQEFIKKQILKKLKLNGNQLSGIEYLKKSIDARGKRPIFVIKVLVYINEIPNKKNSSFNPSKIGNKKVIIVGAGPAGLFAALRLIELGIKPIILERGKDIRGRRIDLKNIMQNHIVNCNSNYCFGEGGAGTYSDGKLYTRSLKRGNVRKVLDLLVFNGAKEEILIDSHPHIGSNKLPKIIEKIRNNILEYGGEIHFGKFVEDFRITNSEIKGVLTNNEEFEGDSVILATGHSARDVYYLLDKYNVKLENKDFAIGVRIEHPQALIDSIQYNLPIRHVNLPAASYNLSCQVEGKGVYSFCMCPGGIIIPASTDQNELVLNGMSVSKRNSKFANSGLVVEMKADDWKDFMDKRFPGIELQKYYEQKAEKISDKSQKAPSQRVTDFIRNKTSNSLPISSYIPGLESFNLNEFFGETISRRLKNSLKVFEKKMKGYITEESLMLAVESRTSSPVRIPRNSDNFMNPQIKHLFPCGEGAGYAGGIVSAALDGINCAEKINSILC